MAKGRLVYVLVIDWQNDDRVYIEGVVSSLAKAKAWVAADTYGGVRTFEVWHVG